ncbi:hypothetical protein B0181_10540 [Moraxella caviae]|uniref:Tail assembly chaperone n=1 Tax=Moraxella caviae TaxID=34060 RepID=A0A1S9ZUZ5_9GAMM|nr:hypothetical protein [Moraxella caviae]OOR87279.1 hypothetical protein B0181_10540 [Moraxella caviae]STZ14055.1 Uncharacterised protein [Moraxella caviae]
MAFILKKQTAELNTDNVGEFTHALGFKITFRSLFNPKFMRASAMLDAKHILEREKLEQRKYDDAFFDDIDDEQNNPNTMALQAIGRFLFVDFDVSDEDGNKVEPTPDNFLLLSKQVGDPFAFVEWCIECATKVAQDSAAELENIKKKPSTATTGKKNTKT